MVPFPRGWDTEPTAMTRVLALHQDGDVWGNGTREPVTDRARTAKVGSKSDPFSAGTTNHSSCLSRQGEEFSKPVGDLSACAHILNVSGKPSHSSSNLRLLRADVK